MNAKSLAYGTLRTVLAVLYSVLRIYVGLVVTYGPVATAIALALTLLTGFAWGQYAAILGGATVLHFVLLRLLDSGYAKAAGAIQRRQFA